MGEGGAFGRAAHIVDSRKLEHACRVLYAGCPSFFGVGLEDGHVPTFWLLLQVPYLLLMAIAVSPVAFDCLSLHHLPLQNTTLLSHALGQC